VYINLFDTRIDKSVELKPKAANTSSLLDFVATWTLGGGTSFNAVISHAVDHGCKDARADVLMITDGHSDVNEILERRLKTFKQSTGTQWSTVCINTEVPKVCGKFSDEMYSVNVYNTEGSVDVIQKCLR
jgi:uncharacterized protein with von Willebrand factor type A (vWA) domain